MRYGKHPFHQSAAEERREAWHEQVERLARETLKPRRTGRVLPVLDTNADQQVQA